MESTISDEEACQNSYHYFIEAVKILSEPPEKQCELVDNYNVAWELKDEVSSGLYLIKDPISFLTEGQKLAIQQLINELNKIPKIILKAENTSEENLKAMKHPAWKPLRKQAAILLRTLEPESKSNEKYFKEN